jgi:hypothetical protein
MNLVPDKIPITVSIQPNKLASLKIADSLGFKILKETPPWTTYVFN